LKDIPLGLIFRLSDGVESIVPEEVKYEEVSDAEAHELFNDDRSGPGLVEDSNPAYGLETSPVGRRIDRSRKGDGSQEGREGKENRLDPGCIDIDSET